MSILNFKIRDFAEVLYNATYSILNDGLAGHDPTKAALDLSDSSSSNSSYSGDAYQARERRAVQQALTQQLNANFPDDNGFEFEDHERPNEYLERKKQAKQNDLMKALLVEEFGSDLQVCACDNSECHHAREPDEEDKEEPIMQRQ